MSEELPEGWVTTTLGDLTEYITSGSRGWAQYYADSGALFLRVGNLDRNTIRIDLSDIQYVAPPAGVEGERTRVRPGDVLVSITADVGMVGVVPEDFGDKAYVNQHVALCRPADTRLSKYIGYALNDPRGLQKIVGELQYGQTKPGLHLGQVRDLELPLPPLPEQRRIVGAVEALLEQVSRATERLDRVPLILRRFRQAVLAAACAEGDEVEIGDVIESVRYGTAVKCSPTAKGTPVLRIPNVVGGVIDRADMKYGLLTAKERASLNLEAGDILMIRSNGSVGLVGRTALATEREVDCSFAGYLMRLRPKRTRALPEYLHLALQTHDVRVQIEVPARSTSGVHNINGAEVKGLRIRMPALSQQSVAVREVYRLFAFADTIEHRVQAAASRADRLPQAILSKAFAGELVPTEADLARFEGRTYETAEVLLALAATGDGAGPATSKRRRRTARPETT